jgi:hypothetical protein
MTGYAMFLRLFSVATSSDTILAGFQYLMIECSALFLLFTVFYFFRPGKAVQYILLAFMVVNPLCWHLANLISSDGYFLALSLTWFTLLLWVIYQPGRRIIFWHTLVVCLVFTVRYNAALYPVIAIVVLALCKQPFRSKLLGIGAMVLLCGLFAGYTCYHFKKLTGTWQYSPFNGWLTANNALYAYRHIDSAQRKPVPQRFKQLDQMVRAYYDTTQLPKSRKEEKGYEAVVGKAAFMWSPNLMLFKYREHLFRKDTSAAEFKKWASMGPFYGAYGRYLIRQYPMTYFRYFIWPNVVPYYAPRVEFLSKYNTGYDEVWPVARQWFGYKTTTVKTRTKDKQVTMLDYYPVLSGVINVVMLCGILCFLMLGGPRRELLFQKGLWLAVAVWLENAVFTILSTSAALRYQAFPIFLTTTFAMLLMDRLWQMGRQGEAASADYPVPDYDVLAHAVEGE